MNPLNFALFIAFSNFQEHFQNPSCEVLHNKEQMQGLNYVVQVKLNWLLHCLMTYLLMMTHYLVEVHQMKWILPVLSCWCHLIGQVFFPATSDMMLTLKTPSPDSLTQHEDSSLPNKKLMSPRQTPVSCCRSFANLLHRCWRCWSVRLCSFIWWRRAQGHLLPSYLPSEMLMRASIRVS